MKIIVDAFGGDNAPVEIIKGCAAAVDENEGLEIVLVGPQDKIEAAASENGIDISRMTIENCAGFLTMEDEALEVRKRKDCSMAVGLKMIASGGGDAFLSAGNSGALITGATLFVKRIKGIMRPAFSPIMPKSPGMFMLIDAGANVECKPEMLRQFGIMGSVYMERVMKIDKPRIGLANVGTEDHKGDSLRHEAFALLKETPVNFVGNVEGTQIPFDGCDVVVADGFTGNLILKMYEGAAAAIMGRVKSIYKKNLWNKLSALMIAGDLKKLKGEVNSDVYGGAPILGAAKPVFKVHGNATAVTMRYAIGHTINYVNTHVIEEIERTVSQLDGKE